MAASTAKRGGGGKEGTTVGKKEKEKKSGTAATAAKKKTAKREPSQAALLKKVASVSDSATALQKEVRAMSKIFGDNQEILVSMKAMIDTLASTLGQIQKQSRRISVIEDDTQKLYSGLKQVREQSSLIGRINDQTARMQEEIGRIAEQQKAPGSQEMEQQVRDSRDSIQNNSRMIIKVAQRIDEIRDDLRKVSAKADSLEDIGRELDRLRDGMGEISAKASVLEGRATIVEDLRQELDGIRDGVSSASGLHAELDAIKATIDDISSKAARIDPLGGVIEGLNRQFESIQAKADSADVRGRRAIGELAGKIDRLETEIGTLSKRADSTAFVGEGLKQVQKDISSLRRNVSEKTGSIEQRITSAADILERQDAAAAEFHKKSDKMFREMRSVRGAAAKASSDSSKEVMALLKLSEYQSGIRMHAESKYGDAKDIEKMASRTADIVNLFDRITVESGERIPLPHEVRQWAVGKILDCADRWEIRFDDVYTILIGAIGRDMLREAIRIPQVREIYGIRAVDKIRKDLNVG